MIQKIWDITYAVKMMLRSNKVMMLKLPMALLLFVLIRHNAIALDIVLARSSEIRNLSYDCDGGEERINVKCLYSAYIGEEGRTYDDWLSWFRYLGQKDSGRLTIDKNMSVYDRTGLIVMDSCYRFSSGGDLYDGEILISVHQSGAPVDVSLDGVLSYNVAGGSGLFSIETESDIVWRIDTKWGSTANCRHIVSERRGDPA